MYYFSILNTFSSNFSINTWGNLKLASEAHSQWRMNHQKHKSGSLGWRLNHKFSDKLIPIRRFLQTKRPPKWNLQSPLGSTTTSMQIGAMPTTTQTALGKHPFALKPIFLSKNSSCRYSQRRDSTQSYHSSSQSYQQQPVYQVKKQTKVNYYFSNKIQERRFH